MVRLLKNPSASNEESSIRPPAAVVGIHVYIYIYIIYMYI